jgi:hypothetical protein
MLARMRGARLGVADLGGHYCEVQTPLPTAQQE